MVILPRSALGDALPPILAAAIVVFCESGAIFAVQPIIDDHCRRLGASDVAAWVGLLMLLTSLPKIVGNPLMGRLSDRFGRRPLLAVATCGTLAGSVGWALAPNLAWLVLARGVSGLFGAQAGLTQALVADITAPEQRAAKLGWLGAAFGAGAALGPLLGGVVADWFGSFAVGWAAAGLQVVSLGIIGLSLGETLPRGAGRQGAATAQRPIWTIPTVGALLAILVLQTVALSQMIATFSPIMTDRYELSPGGKGLGWAVFGLIGVAVQGGAIRPTVRRLGEMRTCALGLAGIAVGCAIIALCQHQGWFWLAIPLVASGAALAAPAVLAALSCVVPPESQGRLAGLNQALLGVARSAGYVGGGALYVRGGPATAYAVATVLSAVAGAVCLNLARRARPALFRGSITSKTQT